MKKNIIIILSVAAFVSGFLIFYQNRPSSAPTKTGVTSSDTSKKWETKIDDQANVTVTVTPSLLSEESREWKFDITLSTHSVELDQDMTKIAVLVDDQGKEYKPTNWDGPSGGHHREGILTFGSITPTPKSVELKISGIGGVDRNFNWSIKK